MQDSLLNLYKLLKILQVQIVTVVVAEMIIMVWKGFIALNNLRFYHV